MDYNAFAVCLTSLHLPDEEGLAALSRESRHLVTRLHRFFQEKLVSSINAFRTAEMVDHSLFCCCLPEGMLLLQCTADPVDRLISMDGFLVTQETLRTAWQLCRWKLLFVCAVGWDRHGSVLLSPDEIEQIAMSLQTPREQQAKLMEASRNMLASPVPFSFAVTSYPLREIPVRFPGAVQEQFTQEAEERGEIIFPAEQAAALAARYRSDISVLKTLRLCCGTKKQYLSLRQKYPAPCEESAALRTSLKEELLQYPGDSLWYFSVQLTNDLLYLRPLRPSSSGKLCAGAADFGEVSAEMEHFITGVYQMTEKLRKPDGPSAGEPAKETAAEPPKTKGFLRSLFSGK